MCAFKKLTTRDELNQIKSDALHRVHRWFSIFSHFGSYLSSFVFFFIKKYLLLVQTRTVVQQLFEQKKREREKNIHIKIEQSIFFHVTNSIDRFTYADWIQWRWCKLSRLKRCISAIQTSALLLLLLLHAMQRDVVTIYFNFINNKYISICISNADASPTKRL